MMRLSIASASLLLVALVAACAPTIREHGQKLDEDAVARIRPGVTAREEVLRLMGSPTTVAAFDGSAWLYVSQKMAHKAFFRPELVDQKVVIVRFDERGIVSRVETRGLDEARAIEPVADATPTMGNELTIWEQFIGNIGRFNRTDQPSRAGP